MLRRNPESAPGVQRALALLPHEPAVYLLRDRLPVRQAAAGLLRLYPLRFSGTSLSRSDRELARNRGVSDADTAELAGRIARVLRRDRRAVPAAVHGLEEMRDRAAGLLMF